MKLNSIYATPNATTGIPEVSLVLAFEGFTLSEAVRQVMDRFSGTSATVSSNYAITLPEDGFPMPRTDAEKAAVAAKFAEVTGQPAASEAQTSADPAPAPQPEPATSSRRRSRSTATEQPPAEASAEAVNPPTETSSRRRRAMSANEAPAFITAAGLTLMVPDETPEQPIISGENAEDRISDADLVKACSLAAAKLAPDVVRLIIRGAGQLQAGQQVTEMPQPQRRQFLTDLDAEVAKMEPAAFTA